MTDYNDKAQRNAIAEIERLTAVVDAAIALRDRIEPRSKGGIADEYYALDAALAALEDDST